MIDPELRNIINGLVEKVRENNKLITKIHRAAVWGRVFNILYWVVIIAFAFGAYYFIQPYVESLLGAYSGLMSGVDSIQNTGDTLSENIPDLSGIGELFKNFGGE